MAELDPLAFQRGLQGTQALYDNARRNKLAQLAFDQKERELQSKNALAGILSSPDTYDEQGNLRREALPKIASADPSQFLSYRKVVSEQEQAQRDAKKAQREELIAQFDWADKNMANVRDQASWDEFRQRAASVYPDVAARLPAQFDPAQIQQNRMKMIPVIEQWKEEQLRERQAQQQQFDREKFEYQQKNDAANRDVTIRGQNMTDTRAREANSLKAAEGKAPTEFQSKAAMFGARAEEADRILSGLDYSPAALSAKQAVSNVPLVGGVLGAAANVVTSPENQKAEQAQRDFINAVLRQESGAVITDSEFDNARKQYFPQPGDSDAVKAQKAANRRTAIEGLKRGAGKAAYSAKPSKPSLSDIFGD
ncbi:hypothetical protein [Cupriavidus gilardii]|uniref:hypothetical protein n=1 Tax=Cupriavidus gilardii TaxID=82541 RepID=UPI002B324E24|nr:hypothetical protein QWJ31_19470 [Cupriavidus gilardii]